MQSDRSKPRMAHTFFGWDRRARDLTQLTAEFFTRRALPDASVLVSEGVATSIGVVADSLHPFGKAIGILR